MNDHGDKSDNVRGWDTEKLKSDADVYHELIYTTGCYGKSDLFIYDAILNELSDRGIEPKERLDI